MAEVRLRNFLREDSKRLAHIANSISISRNLRDGFPHPYTEADAIIFIDKCLSMEPKSFFAIEYKGEYVGNIGLVVGNDVYRMTAELGYFVGEDFWNKGIASQAIKQICDFGFKKLTLHRIYAGVFENNKSSMRVLEKSGFTKEAVFKKAVFKENKILDEHRYALINPNLA